MLLLIMRDQCEFVYTITEEKVKKIGPDYKYMISKIDLKMLQIYKTWLDHFKITQESFS